jgi:hypothetical protein
MFLAKGAGKWSTLALPHQDERGLLVLEGGGAWQRKRRKSQNVYNVMQES